MLQRYVMVACVGLILGLAACDSADPEPPPATLTGRWLGAVTAQGTAFTFELDLTEQATVVSGSGTMTSAQGTAAFAVEGSYTHPLASLRLVFQDRPPVTFNGLVSDDRERIEGEVAGSGFGGEEIILDRQ